MRLIYIAGKYRSETINGVFENIMHSRREGLKLWHEGWAVISPHCNSMFMDGDNDASLFLEGDAEILRRCDAIYMLSGWQESEGASFEHRIATQMGKEVYYEES